MDGQLVKMAWAEDRVIWIEGSAGSGKTTALARVVEAFQAEKGKALVYTTQPEEVACYTGAQVSYTTADALDDLMSVKVARPEAPFLIAVDELTELDWNYPIEGSGTFCERVGQVMRSAEELNAWVVFTSRGGLSRLPVFVQSVLGEQPVPVRKLHCTRAKDVLGRSHHWMVEAAS